MIGIAASASRVSRRPATSPLALRHMLSRVVVLSGPLRRAPLGSYRHISASYFQNGVSQVNRANPSEDRHLCGRSRTSKWYDQFMRLSVATNSGPLRNTGASRRRWHGRRWKARDTRPIESSHIKALQGNFDERFEREAAEPFAALKNHPKTSWPAYGVGPEDGMASSKSRRARRPMRPGSC